MIWSTSLQDWCWAANKTPSMDPTERTWGQLDKSIQEAQPKELDSRHSMLPRSNPQIYYGLLGVFVDSMVWGKEDLGEGVKHWNPEWKCLPELWLNGLIDGHLLRAIDCNLESFLLQL